MKVKLFSAILFLFISFNIFAEVANHVVIAEVYGGGGNSGAYWKNDYIVLYNPTSSIVDLTGWSIQYAAATSSNWQYRTNLSGSISASGYFLIKQAGGSNGSELPAPDAIGNINMNATAGKVALVNNTTALTDTNPSSAIGVVDFVGYGNSNGYEGSGPAIALSNTTSAKRKDNNGNPTYGETGNGWDSNNNSADYYVTSNEGQAPLPVELTSITASRLNNAVHINWQTATEINNYGFEVQRSQKSVVGSQNGKNNWCEIGFVKGSGNSNSPRNYSFIDENISAGNYSYRLKQIDNDGMFKYSDAVEVNLKVSEKCELYQNYPNPFNPATTIAFNLPKAGNIKLIIYNVPGQVIKTLADEFKEAGTHSFSFDGSYYSSGLYFYHLEMEEGTLARKMTLIK